MAVLWGVILHALGGFASGSFYLPYKKVRRLDYIASIKIAATVVGTYTVEI